MADWRVCFDHIASTTPVQAPSHCPQCLRVAEPPVIPDLHYRAFRSNILGGIDFAHANAELGMEGSGHMRKYEEPAFDRQRPYTSRSSSPSDDSGKEDLGGWYPDREGKIKNALGLHDLGLPDVPPRRDPLHGYNPTSTDHLELPVYNGPITYGGVPLEVLRRQQAQMSEEYVPTYPIPDSPRLHIHDPGPTPSQIISDPRYSEEHSFSRPSYPKSQKKFHKKK